MNTEKMRNKDWRKALFFSWRSTNLKMLLDVFNETDVQTCLVGLNKELLDDTALDNGSKALETVASECTGGIEIQLHCLGELSLAVCKQFDFSVAAGSFAPSVHNKRVVHRNTCNKVDAFVRLEFLGLLDVTRQMRLGAARRKRAGHAEKYGLVHVSKQVLNVDRVGGRFALDSNAWQMIASFNEASSACVETSNLTTLELENACSQHVLRQVL